VTQSHLRLSAKLTFAASRAGTFAGFPEILYSDSGSDFTSQPLEQVGAEKQRFSRAGGFLKMTELNPADNAAWRQCIIQGRAKITEPFLILSELSGRIFPTVFGTRAP
jgi:hypothetical protein